MIPSYAQARALKAMKFGIGIAVFFWLLAGLIGAWMLDDLDSDHWKKIARGPITLGEALKDQPIHYPWQD